MSNKIEKGLEAVGLGIIQGKGEKAEEYDKRIRDCISGHPKGRDTVKQLKKDFKQVSGKSWTPDYNIENFGKNQKSQKGKSKYAEKKRNQRIEEIIAEEEGLLPKSPYSSVRKPEVIPAPPPKIEKPLGSKKNDENNIESIQKNLTWDVDSRTINLLSSEYLDDFATNGNDGGIDNKKKEYNEKYDEVKEMIESGQFKKEFHFPSSILAPKGSGKVFDQEVESLLSIYLKAALDQGFRIDNLNYRKDGDEQILTGTFIKIKKDTNPATTTTRPETATTRNVPNVESLRKNLNWNPGIEDIQSLSYGYFRRYATKDSRGKLGDPKESEEYKRIYDKVKEMINSGRFELDFLNSFYIFDRDDKNIISKGNEFLFSAYLKVALDQGYMVKNLIYGKTPNKQMIIGDFVKIEKATGPVKDNAEKPEKKDKSKQEGGNDKKGEDKKEKSGAQEPEQEKGDDQESVENKDYLTFSNKLIKRAQKDIDILETERPLLDMEHTHPTLYFIKNMFNLDPSGKTKIDEETMVDFDKEMDNLFVKERTDKDYEEEGINPPKDYDTGSYEGLSALWKEWNKRIETQGAQKRNNDAFIKRMQDIIPTTPVAEDKKKKKEEEEKNKKRGFWGKLWHTLWNDPERKEHLEEGKKIRKGILGVLQISGSWLATQFLNLYYSFFRIYMGSVDGASGVERAIADTFKGKKKKKD